MDKNKKVVYPNLMSEMARNGVTQTMIAKIIGVSFPTVSRKFSGQNDWTLEEVNTICEYFNKDYYYLFIKKNK